MKEVNAGFPVWAWGRAPTQVYLGDVGSGAAVGTGRAAAVARAVLAPLSQLILCQLLGRASGVAVPL